MRSKQAKIFIVDDDPSVRKGLERLIKSIGHEHESFTSADDFLKRKHYAGIGCLILDIRMPGLNGLELQEELNRRNYTLPIIFITGHGDIPMSVRAMKSGAVDFLPKPFHDRALVDAIDVALEKHIKTCHEIRQLRDVSKRLQKLTPREYDVFRHVIAGDINKQTAAKLGISEKTVKIHRGRVMEKMQVKTVAELVRLADISGLPTPSYK